MQKALLKKKNLITSIKNTLTNIIVEHLFIRNQLSFAVNMCVILDILKTLTIHGLLML